MNMRAMCKENIGIWGQNVLREKYINEGVNLRMC